MQTTKKAGQGCFSSLQVGLRAKELAVRSGWLLPLKVASRYKQVDWGAADESALSTEHHLQVSASSTLKAEPKSIPRHQDSSLLLPLIFSTCCSPHKPSYAMFVCKSRDSLSCRNHLKE